MIRRSWARWLTRIALLPEGARTSDLLLPLGTFAITAGVTIGSFQAYQGHKTDAVLVSLAGRQRMLSQKLHREVLQGEGGAAQALDTLQLYAGTAKLLKEGGRIGGLVAQGDSFPDDSRVPAASTDESRNKLDQQISLSSALEQHLGRYAGTGSAEDLADVARLVEEASANSSATVGIFVAEAQQRVRAMLLLNVLALIGLAGFGLWLNRSLIGRRHAMDQLSRAKEAAIQASAAKSSFLANMSHEIRTPLNAIIGMADLLENTELSAEQKRFVQSFKRASDTLLALVNDVLDLSKIESGQIELDATEMDLRELIDRAGEIMALRAHQKGLELVCYIAPDVPRFVIGDPMRLREVLMNLLSNAVKFTSAGEVVLRVELDPGASEGLTLRFAVSDTGIGIPESKFASIFENFAQADPSIAYSYGGTGLGLAIAKRLVALMNGRIWVKSQVGVGSTFYFTARFQSAERDTQDSQPEILRQALAGTRVLVVDDNDTNRFIVRKYLEGGPRQVDQARSGPEALERLREVARQGGRYDAILLDYRMPGMNGYDVAHAIRTEKLAEGAVILLLTSDGKRSDVGRLSGLGVSHYMVKPIRRDDLLSSVARALSRMPVAQLAERPAAARPSKFNRNLRFLAVDDVEENRFVMASLLRGAGWDVQEAVDGSDAVAKFKAGEFDLVLMDMRMPVLDGYSATRRIRELEKQENRSPVPIIAVTAHALREEVEKSVDAGCDFHLSKPITKARLMDMISRALPGAVSTEAIPAAPATRTAESGPIRVKVEEFLKHRIPTYVENRKNDVVQLREAVRAGDFEQVAHVAHNVAGTAGIYGMHGLSEISREMEISAETRKDPSDIQRLLVAIEDYLARVTFE